MLRVPQIIAIVHPYSIIQSDLYVSLYLQSPKVELETFDDGSSSWELRTQDDDKEAAVIAGLEIVGGEINYNYPLFGRHIVVKNVNANMHFPSDNKLESSGAMSIANANYQFMLSMDGVNNDNAMVDLAVYDGSSTLSAKGKWSKPGKSFEGEQMLESPDFGAFLRNFVPKILPSGQIVNAGEPEQPVDAALMLPLKWQSKVNYSADKLSLDDIVFSGDYIQGKGNLTAEIAVHPDIVARFDFDKLSFEPLSKRGILYDILTHSDSTEIVEGYKVNLPEGRRTALPNGVSLSLVATGKEVVLLGLPAQEMQLQAKLVDSKIQIGQFSAKLPGETQLIVKGDVEGSYEGISLKGQLDFGGKEFKELAPYIFGKSLAIPERLKQFRGRSNIFLTPDLARFSESILRVEDYQVLGTILRKKQKMPIMAQEKVPEVVVEPPVAYEGALRLDNINFDELIDAQASVKPKENNQYPNLLYLAKQWQNDVAGASLDMRMNLIDFMLGGQKRSRASVDMVVNGGGVALNNVETSYNGTMLSGSMGVSFAAQALPEIQANIKADTLNTKTFFEHDFAQDESILRESDGSWSKKEFNLDWAKKVNGNLTLTVGNLSHEVYELNNVLLEASIKDSLVKISNLSAGIWGGGFLIRSQMLASKLPSFSGTFSLKNIDIIKLKTATDLFGDLLGRISLTGEFVTTGVNPFIAMQNTQGAISVIGSGITITGFNLANMVRAANTVRTVDDIDKIVEFADQGGTTNVSLLQGSINLAGGFLRSPGITINTQEGAGNINGQLSVMDWNLNAAVMIYLTALQQQSPPSIRLIFAGPLNKAARTLDTQSLESFIAKQAAERILETR
jgi:hypothetical protein